MNKNKAEVFDYKFYDKDEVKSNLLKYQEEILDAVWEHYDSGGIDDINKNHHFMNLLACLCEGRVTVKRDEENDRVLWKLSTDSHEKISTLKNILMDKLSQKKHRTVNKKSE